MKRLVVWINTILKKQKRMKRWQRIITVLASVMIFATTYALILPAITVEKDNTDEVAGMYLEYAAVPENAEETLDEDGPVPGEIQSEIASESSIASQEEDPYLETTAANSVEEENAPAAPVVLTTSGADYTVNITCDENSGVPSDAELLVSEILQGTEEYDKYLWESGKAMGLPEEEIFTKCAARFFDIKIMVGGAEFKPENGVTVEITYDEPLAENLDKELSTLHFKDETNGAEVVDTTTAEVREDGTVAVEFQAESFSVYGVVGTGAITTTYLTSKGETYFIKVDIDGVTNIPVGSKLVVREIEKGTEEYDKLVCDAWNKINQEFLEWKDSEQDPVEEEKLYLRNILQAVFFDISFTYKGEEIEPDAPVKVEIQLADGLDNMEGADSSVVHFSKDEDVELINGIETKGNEEKVETFKFVQDSFSIDGLITSVEAKEVVKTPSSLNVITKAATLREPDAHKWKEPNNGGDGTYKIHLSVTGDAESSDDVTKANILVIMDESSSMNYGQLTSVGSANRGTPNFTPNAGVTYYGADGTGPRGGINARRLNYSGGTFYMPGLFTSTRYTGTVYTFKSRLSYEQEALGLLVDTLLANNSDGTTSNGTSLQDVVEIAVIGFNDHAWTKSDWSTNADALKTEINKDQTGDSTHWWDALNLATQMASEKHTQQDDEDIYVIFLTDGRPLQNPDTEPHYDELCVPAVQNLMNLGSYIHLSNIYTYASLIDKDMDNNKNPGGALGNSAIGTDTADLNGGRYPNNEYPYLSDLTNVASAIGDASYRNAESVQDLLDELGNIVSKVNNSIAYGRVTLTDTVTSSASATTLVNGNADGFTYTVTGTQNYTVTSTGTDDPDVVFTIDGNTYHAGEPKIGTDNKPYYEVTVGSNVYKMALASFDDQTHQIQWDLGGIGTLVSGNTYDLSFDIWPNQEAYDTLADLNNGIKTWDEDNDVPVLDDNGDILYYTGGVDNPDIVMTRDGAFTVLTNTEQTLSYWIIKDDNGQITYEGPYEKPLETPEPMGLTDRTVKIQKAWEDTLDDDELQEAIDEYEGEGGFQAKLELKKGTETYIDGINIKPVYKTADGDLVHEKETEGQPNELQRVWPEIEDGQVKTHDISAGLMISENMARASGMYAVLNAHPEKYPKVTSNLTTYFLLDSGHDYSFSEDDIDPHFELEENVYHPMVVDNELKNVVLTMNGNTGTAVISDLDTDEDDNPVVKANNVLKGGINVLKKVFDSTGEEVTEVLISDDTFKVKVTMVQKDGTPYENWDYRIYYGQNNPAGEWSEENQNYGRTGHFYGAEGNGGVIEAELYVGDVLRIVNVPAGVSYSVEETEYDNTIYSLGTNFTFGYMTNGAEKDFTTDSTGVSYMISTGTADNFVVDTEHKVKGNSASQAIVVNKVPTAHIKLLKLGDATTPLEDVTFKLYYDKECTRIVTKDALGAAIPSIDADGVIHTDADGYANLGTLAGTYYLKEITTKDNYILLNKPIKISIVKDPANDGQEKVTAECEQADVLFPADPTWIQKDDDGIWIIKINNPSGAVLPSTGGPGTLLYTLSGLALILASALMYGFRMRRRERRLN